MLHALKGDLQLLTALGRARGILAVHKFGRATATTTERPVALHAATEAGIIRETAEQVSTVSGSANDAAAGSGMRTLLLEGVNQSLEVVSETVELNGLGAVVSANSYRMLRRAYGVTAGDFLGSNAGAITITGSDSSLVKATIPAGRGQSELGFTAVPTGYRLALLDALISIDGTKSANVRLYRYEDGGAKRIVEELVGVAGEVSLDLKAWKVFPAGTFLWWTAETASGTSEVEVDFDYLLIPESLFA